MGHSGSRVETKVRIIANDETNAVEVMAWKTEVGVERYEGPKYARVENGVQLHGNALIMPNMTRGSSMFITHVEPRGVP